MRINWIGLWTMVRREVSRLMRVPIQAFVAPWISALLFIFIFGFVVGGRIASIGGHRYLEFVLPGIVMMNIVNAAFLQSSSQIYFSRFQQDSSRRSLVSPLSYVEMIVGALVDRDAALVVHRASASCSSAWRSAPPISHSCREFLFWVVSVSTIFGLLGIIVGAVGQEFRAAQHARWCSSSRRFRWWAACSTRSACCRRGCAGSPGAIRSSISSTACATP